MISARTSKTDNKEVEQGRKKLKALDAIRQENNEFPYSPAVKEWKRAGKLVLGWNCRYLPEEVIWAAGILPVRITGGFKELNLDDANSYLGMSSCSFVRSCMEGVLAGGWDFLDGFVCAATCDNWRRWADYWQGYFDRHFPLLQLVSVPVKTGERAQRFYVSEIREMMERLESTFGLKITNDALWEAIRLYNKTRDLLRQVYELRKADRSPLSGAQTMEVMNAGLRMPKNAFNDLLQELLTQARNAEPVHDGEIRLMVSGSPLNNPDFIKGIEDQGALVVADDLCMGIPYWTGLVDTKANDPLEAICVRYLNAYPCGRMVPADRRLKRMVDLVKEYRVDGIVSRHIRNCPQYAFDPVHLDRTFPPMGVPVLHLDVEYGTSGTGQVTTRAQAFVEMLRDKKRGQLEKRAQ